MHILKKMYPDETDRQILEDRSRLTMGAAMMLSKLALDVPDPERNENYMRHVMKVLLSPIQY